MGLFDNIKLSLADRSCRKGDYASAEARYAELAPRHPLAAAHYATMLLDRAKASKDKLSFLRKAVSLTEMNLSQEARDNLIPVIRRVGDYTAKGVRKLLSEKKFEHAINYASIIASLKSEYADLLVSAKTLKVCDAIECSKTVTGAEYDDLKRCLSENNRITSDIVFDHAKASLDSGAFLTSVNLVSLLVLETKFLNIFKQAVVENVLTTGAILDLPDNLKALQVETIENTADSYNYAKISSKVVLYASIKEAIGSPEFNEKLILARQEEARSYLANGDYDKYISIYQAIKSELDGTSSSFAEGVKATRADELFNYYYSEAKGAAKDSSWRLWTKFMSNISAYSANRYEPMLIGLAKQYASASKFTETNDICVLLPQELVKEIVHDNFISHFFGDAMPTSPVPSLYGNTELHQSIMDSLYHHAVESSANCPKKSEEVLSYLSDSYAENQDFIRDWAIVKSRVILQQSDIKEEDINSLFTFTSSKSLSDDRVMDVVSYLETCADSILSKADNEGDYENGLAIHQCLRTYIPSHEHEEKTMSGWLDMAGYLLRCNRYPDARSVIRERIIALNFDISDEYRYASSTRTDEMVYAYLSAEVAKDSLPTDMWQDFVANIKSYSSNVHEDELLSLADRVSEDGRFQESNDICVLLDQERVKDVLKKNVTGIFSSQDILLYPELESIYTNNLLHDYIARLIWGLADDVNMFSDKKRLSLYRYVDSLLKSESQFNLSFLKTAANVAISEQRIDDDLSAVFAMADERNLSDSGMNELLDIAFSSIKNKIKGKNLLYPVSHLLRKRRPDFAVRFVESSFAKLRKGESVAEDDLYNTICLETDPIPDLATLAGIVSRFKEKFIDSLIIKLTALYNECEGTITSYLSPVYANYGSSSLISDLLSIEDQSMATCLANVFVTDRSNFLNSGDALASFGEAVINLNDKDFSCACLYTLIKDGASLANYYYDAVKSSMEGLDLKSKLARVNVAIGLLPTVFEYEKLALAKEFLDSGDPDTAIITCRELPESDGQREILFGSYLARFRDTDNLISKADALRAAKNYASEFGKEDELNSYAVKLADALFVIGEKEKAFELLLYYPCVESCDKYCTLKLTQAESEDSVAKSLNVIFKAVEESCVYGGIRDILSSFTNLLTTTIRYAVSKSEHQFSNIAIQDLESCVQLIKTNAGCRAESILTPVMSRLHDLCIQTAREMEEEHNYTDASKLYKKANDSSKDITAIIRSAICIVKDEKSHIDECRKAYTAVMPSVSCRETMDLAYRYSLRLVKVGELSEARKIAEEVLQDSSVVELCESYRLRLVKQDIVTFNERINSLKKGTMSLDEAVLFKQSIPQIAEKVGKDYPDYKSKILSYLMFVDSCILRMKIYNGRAAEAFDSIRGEVRDILSDRNILKRLVVAAMAAIEGNELSESNYKEIISVWLSGIYMDQLLVESLEQTTWDDGYTFTLTDSFGCSGEDDYANLPENVNFEEKSDSCIAIADVQRVLLERGESVISEQGGNFYDFFRDQKSAIDSLRDLFRDAERCALLPPFMYDNGRHGEYREALRTFLDGAAKRLPGLIFTGDGFVFGDPDETPYVVGYTYGFVDGDYWKYHVAQESMKACLAAAESLKNIRTSFSHVQIEQVSSFNGLRSKFIEGLKSAFDSHMSGGKSVSALLPPLSYICNAVDDDNLSYKLTDYVNGCVVRKLNAHEIPEEEGLPLLLDAYDVFHGNDQLKTNISKVLENVVFKHLSGDTVNTISSLLSRSKDFHSTVLDSFNDQTMMLVVMTGNRSAAEGVLDSIKTASNSSKIASLKRKLLELEVQKELSQIIDDVNEKRVTTLSAFRKMEKLYSDHPNMERVYENFCIITKNAAQEGKIDISRAYSILSNEYSRHSGSSTVRSSYASILLLQARKNVILPYTALGKIQSVYMAHNSDGEVCELLAIAAINAILEHIRGGDSYSQSTKSTLDTLYVNRSSTFKLKASSHFSDTFNSIKGQFDTQTWNLLKPSGYGDQFSYLSTLINLNSTRTLNLEGERMKTAIGYIYKFSRMS